ncbi:MAG: TetR/AcrR family transcriptional regulator [Stomatobaculum sp.]|nr:TetR/AcrR family transcriptional regulator [Stomatobaculum sp.]
MATDRFLKLSEEKKQRILAAGFAEFARCPYRDASINRIIKDADISRGSFYTYFEDKMSLFCFILAELIGKFDEEVFGFLDKSRGDPFLCAEQIYETCRTSMQSNEVAGFVKNLFSDTETLQELMADGRIMNPPDTECQEARASEEETAEEAAAKEEGSDAESAKRNIHRLFRATTHRVWEMMDHEKYDLDEEHTRFLYPLIMMLTFRSGAVAARFPDQEKEIHRALNMELNLLKYGALRREKTTSEGDR